MGGTNNYKRWGNVLPWEGQEKGLPLGFFQISILVNGKSGDWYTGIH